LNDKREEVAEMENRMSGGDIPLEGQIDDGDESNAPIAYLSDSNNQPTAVLAARQRDMLQTDGIARALESIDARSRRIIEARWLTVDDDASGGSTLHDLAADFGVSA
ncbi:RNA polymerase sigma factor RpoH, partial [Burkholderia pseudomallei]